ncbi:MAG: hypothetical protein LAP87_05180, partial [Acidobacteriia bacterium]|nr:hypothetical protein [Terriglobia bacterium]
ARGGQAARHAVGQAARRVVGRRRGAWWAGGAARCGQAARRVVGRRYAEPVDGRCFHKLPVWGRATREMAWTSLR